MRKKRKTIWRWVRKLWSLVMDLIYPPRCPICDELLLPGRLICPECLPKLSYVKKPRCLICGKHINDPAYEYCLDCRKKPHYYKEGRALLEYRSIAPSMYRFKYAGRREYARFYGRQIAYHLKDVIEEWDVDALVPVPIHRSRRIQRGYNQAEVLAKEIGFYLGIPVETHLLKRVKKTLPQKLLDDRQRQNNLKNAFKIGRNDVKCKSTIVIDDIYTTGSTIDHCAKVLKQHGVERIYYISIAIGREEILSGGQENECT